MFKGWQVTATAAIVLIIATTILLSCGGGASSSLNTRNSSILSEVDSAVAPAGVDTTVFEQLKNELKRQLEERLAGSDRLASAAPLGPAGYVSDLAYDQGTNTLTWSYVNVGDYDQNGEVGVPDITPIAQHYMHTYDTVNGWPDTLDAIIDGDASGDVGIPDITPIAQNYLNSVVVYDILTSDTENGSYNMIGSVSFPSPSTPPVTFAELLPAGNLGWVRVQPFDSGSNGGEQSNPVKIFTVNQPPEANFDYTQQQTGYIVDFNAMNSSDSDGSIVKYEWDWDNDGTYDFDAGSVMNASHDYGSAQTTDCTLRVTDDDGDTGTETKTVYVLQLATNWVRVDLMSESEGDRPSLAFIGDQVSGKPAIAYYNNFDSHYMTSTDDYGATWGTPSTIDTYIPSNLDLADIGGYPAIAYNDYQTSVLKYVRATNAEGTAWGTIIDADTTNEAGKSYIDMLEVNGNPAIAYYVGDTGATNYIRATDAAGNSWGTSIVVHPFPPSSTYASLAVIGGVPAIALQNNSPVKAQFMRGDDANGSGWSAPLDVSPDGSISSWTTLTELQTVPKVPAIACAGDGATSVVFFRATDTAGTNWQDAIFLEDETDISYVEVSMAVVNGYPCIAYSENNHISLSRALVFRQGLNPEGTAWSEPIYVALDTAAEDVKLIDVRGRPAICYYVQGSAGGIKYAYSPPA